MKVFLTFGGTAESSKDRQNYHAAVGRLCSQARATGYFDKVIGLTDADLRGDPYFSKEHVQWCDKTRGFGYWIWKSYVIKKTMETLSDGDTLFYADCGCEIGGDRARRIPFYLDAVVKERIIASDTGCVERDWCKRDLLLRMEADRPHVVDTNQVQAGLQCIYVSDFTRRFIDSWFQLCTDYKNIDDSPSEQPNYKTFREHRHDQSVYSLLWKKAQLPRRLTLEGCVYIARNRTGRSRLPQQVYSMSALFA